VARAGYVPPGFGRTIRAVDPVGARDGAGAPIGRVRRLGAILAAVFICGGCAVARVPIGAGPPFLHFAGLERLSELPAVSPPAWAPDGASIAFSTADAVWVIRPAAVPRDEHRLARVAGVKSVAWSPDGRTLVALAGGRLLGIPLDDPLPRVAAPIEAVRLLAWPPTGQARSGQAWRGAAEAAVAASAPGGGTVVWSVDIATDPGERSGVRPHRLGSVPRGFEARSLAWLAGDTGGVVLSADDPAEDTAHLVFMGSGAHAAPRVQTLAPGDHAPLPSPEGRFIAYLHDEGDGSRVCVMRADGGGRRALTAAGRYTGLAWSPSGTLLAFVEQAGGGAALAIAGVLTGETMRTSEYRPKPGAAPATIAWSADGTRLAFGNDTGETVGVVWLATLERR
jgi:dipeptidyl aminopeptidase/acylaminoacyl peptidase